MLDVLFALFLAAGLAGRIFDLGAGTIVVFDSDRLRWGNQSAAFLHEPADART